MKRLLLQVFLVISMTVKIFGFPYIVSADKNGKIPPETFNLIFGDIERRFLNLGTKQVNTEIPAVSQLQAYQILSNPNNNLNSQEVQSQLNELDEEKLHRKLGTRVTDNTIEANLFLSSDTTRRATYKLEIDDGGSMYIKYSATADMLYNLGILRLTGAQGTITMRPISSPPYITINSLDPSAAPYPTLYLDNSSISGYTSGADNVLKINSSIITADNYIYSLSAFKQMTTRNLTLNSSGLINFNPGSEPYYAPTIIAKDNEMYLWGRYNNHDYGYIMLASSLTKIGNQYGNISFSANASSPCAISTNTGITGDLSVSDFTTVSSFTATGYGVVETTLTVSGSLTLADGIAFSSNPYMNEGDPIWQSSSSYVFSSIDSLAVSTGTLASEIYVSTGEILVELRTSTGIPETDPVFISSESLILWKNQQASDSDLLDGFHYNEISTGTQVLDSIIWADGTVQVSSPQAGGGDGIDTDCRVSTGTLRDETIASTTTLAYQDYLIAIDTGNISAGGWVGTATSDLDMDLYKIVNVSSIQFGGSNSGIIIGVGNTDNFTGNDRFAIAIGSNSYDNYLNGVGIGADTFNNHDYGIGIGLSANDNYTSGIGFGNGAQDNYNYGIGIGKSARNNFTRGIGIGINAGYNDTDGIGIGYNSLENDDRAIALGYETRTNGMESISLGYYAQHNGDYAVSLGAYSRYNLEKSVALGYYSQAHSSAVAIGDHAEANGGRSVAIGAYTINHETNTCKIGMDTIIDGGIVVATITVSENINMSAGFTVDGVDISELATNVSADTNTIAGLLSALDTEVDADTTTLRGLIYDIGVSTGEGSIDADVRVSTGNILNGVVAHATMTINGYTQLGNQAPTIKMKKLVGITAAAEGGVTDVAHGLTDHNKIIGISVIVGNAETTVRCSFPIVFTAGYEYGWFYNSTNFTVYLHPTNSEYILSIYFVVLITYEE